MTFYVGWYELYLNDAIKRMKVLPPPLFFSFCFTTTLLTFIWYIPGMAYLGHFNGPYAPMHYFDLP